MRNENLPCLALLALGACAPVAFESQELALVHDAEADRLTLELVYEGLHAPPDGLDTALPWARRMAAGERVLVLFGWPWIFDLDRPEGPMEELAELPPDLPEDVRALSRSVRGSVNSVRIESAGLFVDPATGRLGAWQRVSLDRASESLAAWNAFANRMILEVADAEVEVQGWRLPREDRALFVEHARAGRPWVAFVDGALEVRYPMSGARAAALLKELADGGLGPEAQQLLGRVDEVELADGALVLRHRPGPDGRLRWTYEVSDTDYDDALHRRLVSASVPIARAGVDAARRFARGEEAPAVDAGRR